MGGPVAPFLERATTPTRSSGTTRPARARSARWRCRPPSPAAARAAAADARRARRPRRATALRRAEDHEQAQFLRDVVEPVRTPAGDEHHVAGSDRRFLVADADPGAARPHVIDLVLRVRLLAVDAAGRQHVEARAEVGRALELEVRAGRTRPGASPARARWYSSMTDLPFGDRGYAWPSPDDSHPPRARARDSARCAGMVADRGASLLAALRLIAPTPSPRRHRRRRVRLRPRHVDARPRAVDSDGAAASPGGIAAAVGSRRPRRRAPPSAAGVGQPSASRHRLPAARNRRRQRSPPARAAAIALEPVAAASTHRSASSARRDGTAGCSSSSRAA